MFHCRLSFRVSFFLLVTALTLWGVNFAYAQQLPDAPIPQNNAPPPPAPPTATTPSQQDSSSGNPTNPANTRDSGGQMPPGQTNPTAPPPGSDQIKTIAPGTAPNTPGSGVDELMTLSVQVNFVSVPVTVKYPDGKLVEGLLANDFSVYEDGIKQQIKFFTSDPFPLSIALIIDLNLADIALRKVDQTFSALGGSFGPFDEVAVFTYGNAAQKQQDFGNSTRALLALNRIKALQGTNSTAPVVGGPFGSGPTTNGKPVDPGTMHVQTPVRESFVLNDAILMAAQELAHRPRDRRKIIFVISDGQEYGSTASYSQVLKVLLTNGIAVYAVGVDSAAMPVVGKMEKWHIPGQGYGNILPKYANATGGDVLEQFSKESIESAYQEITAEARNTYTLGYNTNQTVSSKYRDIEVRVKKPGLVITAKHGYYPLPPQRAEAQPPAESPTGPPQPSPQSQPPQ